MDTGSADALIECPPMAGIGWPNLSFNAIQPSMTSCEHPWAVFQGFAGCPYALKFGHLAIKGLRVIDDLVGGLIHCCLDVLCEHRNNIHGNQIKPFASLHLLIYLPPTSPCTCTQALAGGRLALARGSVHSLDSGDRNRIPFWHFLGENLRGS